MADFELDLGNHHLAILEDETRFKVVNAGRGFGKTSLALADILLHFSTPFYSASGQPLPHYVIYLAPDLLQAKRIFWDRAIQFFRPIVAKINVQDHKLLLTNGATILLCGSNRPDGARGAYATKVVGDEMAFMKTPENLMEKVLRPMLSRVYRKIDPSKPPTKDNLKAGGCGVYLSTPNGRNYFWNMAKMALDGDPDWSYHTYQSLDGGFITAEEIEAAKGQLTYESWRQEYFAEFINPTSLVYYKFKKENHLKPVPFVKTLDIHWAWDFNVNPGCHTTLSHVHKGKTFVFDEIMVGNTPDNVDEFCVRYPPDVVAGIKIYGDYNGSISTNGLADYTLIYNTLVERGYSIRAEDICVYGGNPIVRARVENMNRLFEDSNRKQHVFIDTTACPFLTKDLELLQWRNGKIDKAIDPSLSHASDALGYQLWVTHPIEQKHKEHPMGYRLLDEMDAAEHKRKLLQRYRL